MGRPNGFWAEILFCLEEKSLTFSFEKLLLHLYIKLSFKLCHFYSNYNIVVGIS
jgi:hypothetical protein